MNNYEYGFITKCAEYGVDPEMLIKQAGIGNLLRKVVGKQKALPKYVDYDAVLAAAKKAKKATKAKNMKAVNSAIRKPTIDEIYEAANKMWIENQLNIASNGKLRGMADQFNRY